MAAKSGMFAGALSLRHCIIQADAFLRVAGGGGPAKGLLAWTCRDVGHTVTATRTPSWQAPMQEPQAPNRSPIEGCHPTADKRVPPYATEDCN
jgi:hypothetical protein